MRVEEADGTPRLIVGDETCWDWRFEAGQDVPVARSALGVHFAGDGTELLARQERPAPRRYADYLADDEDDFTRPTGPVTSTVFLGRQAWAVELAPPEYKPHPCQLVVDAETGIVLQQRNDGFGSVEEWTEFVVGDDLDPALFEWNGSSRPEEEWQAEREAAHGADLAARWRWFADNVTSRPMHVVVEGVASPMVHHYEADGSFEASLELGTAHGSLARRPASGEPWERWGDDETAHRWTDGVWDWALAFWELTPTPESLEAIKRQLSGPGED
ncbi:MAG: hypothetical protein ACT4QF_17205 [Sporichthyaceae bacterium]